MAIRYGTLTGIFCCATVLIWVFGLMGNPFGYSDAGQAIRAGTEILLALLATAALLITPSLARRWSISACFTSQLALVLTPLPLISLAWLAGAINSFLIFKAFAVLITLVIVTIVWVSSLLPILPGLSFGLEKSSVLIGAAAIWIFRTQWSDWLAQ